MIKSCANTCDTTVGFVAGVLRFDRKVLPVLEEDEDELEDGIVAVGV